MMKVLCNTAVVLGLPYLIALDLLRPGEPQVSKTPSLNRTFPHIVAVPNVLPSSRIDYRYAVLSPVPIGVSFLEVGRKGSAFHPSIALPQPARAS